MNAKIEVVSSPIKDGLDNDAKTMLRSLYDRGLLSKKTAVELIVSRADANKQNMAMTSWKGKVVRKQDTLIAKNYLTADEIDTLNRLTVIFLETAELRAKNREIITMKFWQENIDRVLSSNDYKILDGKGKISNQETT
jgi:hypothetical protein